MKTIGLIGGMSWESTVTYYQIINREIGSRLGGLHSARCLLYSVDFDEIEHLQSAGDWVAAGHILAGVAQRLEAAGADFLVICTNTMHKVADAVAHNVRIPLLHIADATADALGAGKIKRAALLGTAYTMEQDFYKNKLIQRGIDIIVPEGEDRAFINQVIFQELCRGVVNPASKARFLSVLDQMAELGAQGAILGCTELGLLVTQQDTSLPLFDTAQIHAAAAAGFALEA